MRRPGIISGSAIVGTCATLAALFLSRRLRDEGAYPTVLRGRFRGLGLPTGYELDEEELLEFLGGLQDDDTFYADRGMALEVSPEGRAFSLLNNMHLAGHFERTVLKPGEARCRGSFSAVVDSFLVPFEAPCVFEALLPDGGSCEADVQAFLLACSYSLKCISSSALCPAPDLDELTETRWASVDSIQILAFLRSGDAVDITAAIELPPPLVWGDGDWRTRDDLNARLGLANLASLPVSRAVGAAECRRLRERSGCFSDVVVSLSGGDSDETVPSAQGVTLRADACTWSLAALRVAPPPERSSSRPPRGRRASTCCRGTSRPTSPCCAASRRGVPRCWPCGAPSPSSGSPATQGSS